ncbi:MAG: DUF4998 domain-containing protein [Prevotellaceae bacterium]|jgi:hypothetical protein|nr:DUF4998 domain-containing protein [Prevotellaceae bacterium]
MKHILYSVSLAAMVLAGCGGMDETYKEFRGDGPIVYLGKYPSEAIQVLPGKRRLKMIFPPLTDIRVAKGELTWWASGANHTQTFDIAPKETTEVIIDEHVAEGSYVFALKLYDATGKYSSLATTLNGVTYGNTYEELLKNNNRTLVSALRGGTRIMTIIFFPTDVPPLVATRVAWKENNTTWRDTLIYPYSRDGTVFSPDTLKISNFCSDSLAYSAIFKPESTFIDEFVVGPKYEKESDHKDGFENPADWTSK